MDTTDAAGEITGLEDASLGYEDALAELEQLVGRIESGALPLDDLLIQYRRGAQLLIFCRQRLTQVENQVKLLEEGEFIPWPQV